MSNGFNLKGCTVCTTGATGHLGSVLVRGLAAAGANLIITARDAKRLEALRKEIENEGGQVEAFSCDISVAGQREHFAKEILARVGRLDILINNAHGGRPGPWYQSGEDDFAFAQTLAVTAPHDLIQRLLPLLKKGADARPGGASVINVSSMYGVVSPDPAIYGDSGLNSPPQYGAAKAGMVQLSRYLAVHLACHQIRVNSITPGPFPRAEIQAEMPDFCTRLVDKVPLKRLGKPEELIGPVLFLASEASSFVTGTNLPVDGGWTAW